MEDGSTYSPAARVLALKMTGHVGPRTFEALMARFLTLDNIFLASREELEELNGIGPAKSAEIAEAAKHLEKAQAIIDQLDAIDVRTVTSIDGDYPHSLFELNDPPPLLFYRGRLPQNEEKRVALVGSQNASAEGIADAVRLSGRLAKAGVSIVSGLARGIDTASHIGALKAGGVSYAVLPCGINLVHPEENGAIANELVDRGGLISEYAPDLPVNAGRLMSRNRIIVGLAQAVVIGETAPDSVGTLDAALCCHQLGKILFVVAGRNDSHYEQLVAWGAIPLAAIDEYELILKALV